MMRRFATLLVVLALLLGGGLTSCLAAVSSARALECCSRDCPRPPAHGPNECCSVGTSAQDGEVAPAVQLTNVGWPALTLAMTPVAATCAPLSSARIALRIAQWTPPPRYLHTTLCLLQL